ncbi:fatty acyl-AMP ligase [Streptomyces sp. NBC_00083]|uniref:fatty acyl-AMP ligase n=1 Tax=Streptomyces sp. NBC_00083 TaxID=2975647 RepID=UPI002250D249|nr:fatty acyl-AMP ligase [Streptomyces sp. NBC_00083]MCX5385372.1 fatty acyl-AMP ligase [Streptomyces sp. NBC_00083]
MNQPVPTARTPRPATVVEALLLRAAGPDADRPVFTALGAAGERVDRVTAAELLGRVRATAAALRTVTSPGDRVVVPALPGADFPVGFLACLYAGLIAVPVPPLRTGARARTSERADRLAVIRGDCGAVAVLVSPGDEAGADGPDTDGFARVAVARSPAHADSFLPAAPAALDAAAVALLQYTSGSTSDPRGVIVGHGNLVANQIALRDRCDVDSGTTVVSWLPFFHDMGLCTGVALPLVSGAAAVTMEPATFVRDPLVWLRAIEAEEDVFAAAPDFAYELCVRRVPARERDRLDLSTWRVAANGAEPVRAETLRRFADAFRPSFFRTEVFSPGYGLAECTLSVTLGRPLYEAPVRRYDRDALARGAALPAASPGSAVELVGCGTVLDGVRIRVVDPETRRPLPEGSVGEIWVDSPGNCLGYWGREAESAQVFAARLEGENLDGPAGPDGPDGVAPGATSYVRTGDLGCVEGGELFITGRLKDVLVVGGENYFPQDIEAVAGAAHAAFAHQRAAAWPLDEAAPGVAVVVETTERDPEVLAHAVRAAGIAVARALPAPVSVFAVARNQVPRTTSGKTRRRDCAKDVRAGRLPLLAQWSSR